MVNDVTDVDAWWPCLEGCLRGASPDDASGRLDVWRVAIGLQAVDGLSVSDYLLEISREHIKGSIGSDEVEHRIVDHHQASESEELDETKEADIVSSRIARLLGERSFVFSPLQLKAIHRVLFEGLLSEAGEWRTYDIAKREWALGWDTVRYAPADLIAETLAYDFSRERSFVHGGMERQELVHHVASFISDVWQVHPFCEGNTRTTVVFAIKYLSSLGLCIESELFGRHSRYFRGALVRANYEDVECEVFPTRRYLNLFFDNLLLGATHELDNDHLRIYRPVS